MFKTACFCAALYNSIPIIYYFLIRSTFCSSLRTNGANGTNGTNGANGANGASGANRANGAKGANGPN